MQEGGLIARVWYLLPNKNIGQGFVTQIRIKLRMICFDFQASGSSQQGCVSLNPTVTGQCQCQWDSQVDPSNDSTVDPSPEPKDDASTDPSPEPKADPQENAEPEEIFDSDQAGAILDP